MPPEAEIEESVATLPGLDGRKMSKSYDNTIPLFAPTGAAAKVDCRHRDRLTRAGGAQSRGRLGPVPDLPGLCHARLKPMALRQAYADGIAWGDAKQLLV